MNKLLLIKDARVAVLTFGGHSIWTAVKDSEFYYDAVIEVNFSFVILRSGLNQYVFEANSIKLLE